MENELIDWLFAPQMKELEDLGEEINALGKDISNLKLQLMESGWTIDEIESLIDESISFVSDH